MGDLSLFARGLTADDDDVAIKLGGTGVLLPPFSKLGRLLCTADMMPCKLTGFSLGALSSTLPSFLGSEVGLDNPSGGMSRRMQVLNICTHYNITVELSVDSI